MSLRNGARDGVSGADPRAARQPAASREHLDSEGGFRLHEEKEKRYPIVPVQAIALEPEQQGGTGPDI